MDICKIKELTSEYVYKIDFHTHTSPASPCSQITPDRLISDYKQIGFNGVVVTNHFSLNIIDTTDLDKAASKYLKDYYDTLNAGEKHSIRVYLGLEARFPENCNDYLVYGIAESDIKPALELLKYDYKTFYREFKTPQNLILQAHPFRKGMELADPEFLDGIEVFNMHPNHNSRVAIAAKCAAENKNFVISGGTDFHHEGQQGMCATCVKAMPENSFGIADILREKDFVFKVGANIILP